jgi:glycosyltransferase involved in cell wall biosynthesis
MCKSDLTETPQVLLIANYQPDGQYSMLRYAELLQVGLEQAGVEAHVWRPPVVLTRFIPVNNRAFKWVAYLDKFVLGGFALLFAQLGWRRVHICDHSNAMYRFVLWGRRVTITCHDVIAIEAARGMGGWEVRSSGRLFQQLIFEGLRRCHAILCVSNYTREHLLALGGVDSESVSVAYNPVDPALTSADQEAVTLDWKELKKNVGGDYILHVGQDHPRKNRIGVVKIFCVLIEKAGFKHSKLLLVGPEVNAEEREILLRQGLLERVVATRLPSESDLAAAYRCAKCLLFPSYLEGFGWPIAEAQSLGCPVFTSNAQPMIEVGGRGARYIEPDQHAEAASVIADADLVAMRNEGFQSVKRFCLSDLVSKVMGA